MDEHVHDWKLPDGGFIVIDTMPPQYPYHCECGAFTHDTKTGKPCATCASDDYLRRSTDLVQLEGGDYSGKWIVRPSNQSVNLRCGPESRGRFLIYKQTDDKNVWRYWANDWTSEFKERTPQADQPLDKGGE